MQEHYESRAVPDAEKFREFVVGSLEILKLSAASVSERAGVTKNTLGKFIKRESREIHLTTASKVASILSYEARVQGRELPAWKGQSLGQTDDSLQ